MNGEIIMKSKKIIKNDKGFTLIEIIAVIIIMGILAAVAVPKFFSMQEDAKQAALSGGISEAAARFNHAYARFILDAKRAPTGIDELYTAAYLGVNAGVVGTGESIGDFNISWRAGAAADEIVIYVESAETIPDMTGLDAARQKTIGGVTWG